MRLRVEGGIKMNLIEQLEKVERKEEIFKGVLKASVIAKETSAITIEPGKEIELHVHDKDHEIYMVLKGVIKINGINCTEGEFRICNCGESHRALNASRSEAIILSIKIDAA